MNLSLHVDLWKPPAGGAGCRVGRGKVRGWGRGWAWVWVAVAWCGVVGHGAWAQSGPRWRVGDVQLSVETGQEVLISAASQGPLALLAEEGLSVAVVLCGEGEDRSGGVLAGRRVSLELRERKAMAGGGLALGLGPAGGEVWVWMRWEPTQRELAGESWRGVRYRYEVAGGEGGGGGGRWAGDLVVIEQESAWTLGGRAADTVHAVGNIYGPSVYEPGSAQKLNTFAGGRPHSRLAKAEAFDLQATRGALLLHTLDEPGLVLSGMRGEGGGQAVRVTDRYVLSVGEGEAATPWRSVLVWRGRIDPRREHELATAWMRVAWATRGELASAAGVEIEPATPLVATGPRMDLAETLLPRLAELGIRRVSVGPIWESSATRGDGRTSMSTYSLEVAEQWGGWAGLERFCTAAEQHGIEVLAWFPFMHLSETSPQLSRLTQAESTNPDAGSALRPLNLHDPAVHGWVLEGLGRAAAAGLDGLWLDSYHNLAFESLGRGSRSSTAAQEGEGSSVPLMPQVRQALSLQAEIEGLGLTLLAEAYTPYGVSSCGMIGGRREAYARWPWFALGMSPYLEGPHGTRGGYDPENYGRFLAFRSPLFLSAHLWPHRVDLGPLEDHADELASLHRTYAAALPRMQRPDRVLPGNRAVIWDGDLGKTIWALEDGVVELDGVVRLSDLSGGGDISRQDGSSRFQLEKDHAYAIDSLVP